MIKNIIFSGGGLKGWAYIGTIQALDELDKIYSFRKNLEQVIGVSIGSLFALFYVLNIKWNYLLDTIIELNLKDFFDSDINDIFSNQSIIAGIKFMNIIKEIISTKINPDVTFNELKMYTNVLFTVNALNINNSKLEYFNYTLTPDIKVIDAVRASAGIPLLFPAYCINGNYYYDGGICNNCPIDIVDELGTIAFDIGYFPEKNKNPINVLNLLSTLMKMCNSKKDGVIFKILDKRFDTETLNLNQTKDDIFNIYMIGYINSKKHIYDNFFAIK